MRNFLLTMLFVLPSAVFAQDLTFDDITKSEIESITRDFSANFTHTAVTGANTLGSVFGFEVGLIFGGTKIEELEDIIKETDPDADVPGLLPHGGLMGMVSVPFGWTFEATLIPQFGEDDFKFSNLTAAVKWSITETLLSELPLSIAIRGHYAKTSIDFTQIDPGGTPATVNGSLDNTVTGLQAVVSKNFLVFSPYAAVGFLQGSGDLSVNGTDSIFNFTASNSASADVTSTQIVIGGELKLAIFKLAGEYSRQFETERFTAKASFYF